VLVTECKVQISLSWEPNSLVGIPQFTAYNKKVTGVCGCRGKVTGLAYHPSDDIAATVGTEGKLQLWSLDRQPRGTSKARHWQCRATASYQSTPPRKKSHAVLVAYDHHPDGVGRTASHPAFMHIVLVARYFDVPFSERIHWVCWQAKTVVNQI